MQALVTGSAGLIGSHLVDELLRQGYAVRGYDALEPLVHLEGKPDWIAPEAEFIQADVRDAGALARALAGVDIVFHLAAYGGFFPEFGKLCDVNVTGTARLLETIRDGRFDVRKVVVASSQVVYREGTVRCRAHGELYPPERSLARLQAGEWTVPCPRCGCACESVATREDAPTSGQTPYAVSKYAQERLALVWSAQAGIAVTALRYPCTYGPRQSIFNPYTGIISIFSTRGTRGLPPILYEDGEQTRDLCYVEDVARATAFAARTAELDGRVVNVGSGRPVSVRAVAHAVIEVFDATLEPEIAGDFRPGDMRSLFTDPQPLASLGFRTRVELREGLTRYLEWIGTRGDVREYFTQAQDHLRRTGLVQRADVRRAAHG